MSQAASNIANGDGVQSPSKPTPYVIQTDVLQERYARGWHCLGKASSFADEPQALNYFGTRWVAFRGEQDQQLYVVSAYCPHMGADLSKGKVVGNSLRCPFHEWSWGGDGVCDGIPYADRIPPRAVIPALPVLEENGLAFVWYDPEGNAPIPEQRPRRIDDYFSGEWSDWGMAEFPIHSNCRELVDNMADMAHFGPVHYSQVQTFKNSQDGHTYTQTMSGGHDILADEGQGFTSVATYEGPAYMTTTMVGSMDGHEVMTHLLVTHVPVSMEEFIIRLGVMVKKDPTMTEEENAAMVEAYTQMSVDSFIQDVEIWNNKIRIDNPLLCDGDGPVHMLRKWYRQFYTDVADITPDMTAVKERVTPIKYAHAQRADAEQSVQVPA